MPFALNRVFHEEFFSLRQRFDFLNAGFRAASCALLKILNQTDYIDSFVVHQPGDYRLIYRAGKKAYKAGRSVPLVFNRFIDLQYFEIAAINQIETHVFYQQKAVSSILRSIIVKLNLKDPC